jgi:hypothetical protein
MDLFLRKTEHDEELEIGSIGITTFTGTDTAWTWGIDTVLPMRDRQSEGRGADLKFQKAWKRHCARAGWSDEFLAIKRAARR